MYAYVIIKYHQNTITCVHSKIKLKTSQSPIWLSLFVGIQSFRHTAMSWGGQTLAYFSSTGSSFRHTGRFSKCHIWAWNLAIGQSARSWICALFLPRGVEIDRILPHEQRFPRCGSHFKIVRAWNLAIALSSRSCTYTPFLPQEVKI